MAKLFDSLESIQKEADVNAKTITPEQESVLAEVETITLDEQVADEEVSDGLSAIELAQDTQGSVEMLIATIEAFEKRGTALSKMESIQFQAMVGMIDDRVGGFSMVASNESFGSSLEDLAEAKEDLKERKEGIGKRIIEFIKRLIESVKKWTKAAFSRISIQARRVTSTAKALKDKLRSAPKIEGIEIPGEKLGAAGVSVDRAGNQTFATSLADLLEVLMDSANALWVFNNLEGYNVGDIYTGGNDIPVVLGSATFVVNESESGLVLGKTTAPSADASLWEGKSVSVDAATLNKFISEIGGNAEDALRNTGRTEKRIAKIEAQVADTPDAANEKINELMDSRWLLEVQLAELTVAHKVMTVIGQALFSGESESEDE